MKKAISMLALAGAAAMTPGLAAAQATPGDGWSFSVMPYLWLPAVNGDLNYAKPGAGGSSPNVSVDAEKILDALDFAGMLSGIVQKGRWLVATDLIYLKLSGDQSQVKSFDVNPGSGPINVSTSAVSAGANVKLDGTVWSLAGGYALVMDPKAKLNVLAGFRYLGLEAKTDWNLSATVTGTGPLGNSVTVGRTGTIRQKENIWTAIVGLQGRVHFGDSPWFANGYVDVGSGSSAFTWQGVAGIGYAFKWGDVLLDYRYLYYSQDSDKLVDNLSFGGPALGLNFRF
ncbi:MAG: hypothetical protein FIB06_08175 [Betaproteobacteria bacterium]|nr:hypothetical protein [Betaproteobacteria bacterium]